MARAKKRGAARKKTSKPSKASVKSARKMAAKRTRPKKAKSGVRRATKIATKPAAEEKWVLEAAETRSMAAEKSVETTTIPAAIEEPTPNVVVVEEHASVQPATSAPPEGDRRDATGQVEHIDIGPDLGDRPDQKVA
jgi:hypothetical protein